MIVELTVAETISEMQKLKERRNGLIKDLILRAELQKANDAQYREFISIILEGITLLESRQVGDTLDEQWINKRDELLQRAEIYCDNS